MPQISIEPLENLESGTSYSSSLFPLRLRRLELTPFESRLVKSLPPHGEGSNLGTYRPQELKRRRTFLDRFLLLVQGRRFRWALARSSERVGWLFSLSLSVWMNETKAVFICSYMVLSQNSAEAHCSSALRRPELRSCEGGSLGCHGCCSALSNLTS